MRDEAAHEWGTRHPASCEPRPQSETWTPEFLGGLGLGFVEELDEVLLPDGGLGVGSVAVGLVGDGDEDELGVGDEFDGALGDA